MKRNQETRASHERSNHTSQTLTEINEKSFEVDDLLNLEVGDPTISDEYDNLDDEGTDSDSFPELIVSGESDRESIGESSDQELEDADASAFSSIFPARRTIVSNITGQLKAQYPEIVPNYDSDSSTEDDPNRIGNVPIEWYNDLPHIGYSVDGKKVLRPAKGDELDRFLATVDSTGPWTSAFDKNMQIERQLTAEELDIIHRLQKGEIPDASYDPYKPTDEWFSKTEERMPLSAAPEPKRRWVPSKWEKQKILKIVRAIRQGRIVSSIPQSKTPGLYDLWTNDNSLQPNTVQTTAPRLKLPTNAESYNPPPEYLPSQEESERWQQTEPEDRERDYLPQSYSALRLVPGYSEFIKERFHRQLDLYLAPRVHRKRIDLRSDQLLPKLPPPSTLRPFPSYKALGLNLGNAVQCSACSPDGHWALTGDSTGNLLLWEVSVGRPIHKWTYAEGITAVDWCPRRDVSYFIAARGRELDVFIPSGLPEAVSKATHQLLHPTDGTSQGLESSVVQWNSKKEDDFRVLNICLPTSSGTIKQISFHRRGDYVATVSDKGEQVWIHQIIKKTSQCPFQKIKGSVQKVLFHPTKPQFFVATQRYVRIYDLAAQKLSKTLLSGIRWISCIDIHPSGDHLLVGGYDKKLCWFDLELSDKPYKVLRYHSRAIRSVRFHPSYPLFASSSDDGTIQVFHARVYNDLMTDPLIVPLKILRGHDVSKGLGVLDIRWCPGMPWLVSAGADGKCLVWCS